MPLQPFQYFFPGVPSAMSHTLVVLLFPGVRLGIGWISIFGAECVRQALEVPDSWTLWPIFCIGSLG